MECEVKWALGSITTNKASGHDGIPVELFQILKDDAVKVLHSICQQIWKIQYRTGKDQFSFQTQRKAIPKNAATFLYYNTIALISHASKVMLKLLQARLQQYMNSEFQIFKLFRKDRGTMDQIANICWIIRKAREFQKKHLFLLYWLSQSLRLCGPNKLWKILKDIRMPDHLTYLLRNLYAGQESTVRTGHGITNWFQIAKGVHQVCMLSPGLFNLYSEYITRNTGLVEA